MCGAAALVVALGFDAPHLDDTGQVGRLYADAAAGPGVGFWLELAGGALLWRGGGLLLLASTARRSDAVGARRAGGRLGEGAVPRRRSGHPRRLSGRDRCSAVVRLKSGRVAR